MCYKGCFPGSLLAYLRILERRRVVYPAVQNSAVVQRRYGETVDGRVTCHFYGSLHQKRDCF